jgi:hypothetical protein
MKRSISFLLFFSLLAAFAGAGCSHTTQPPPQPGFGFTAKRFDDNVPPTDKEVLRSLLASQNVKLTVDESCTGVGTDSADSTIGDYISGFLAQQTSEKGKNWLDISVRPNPAENGTSLWKCVVVIRHVNGDDRWGWGVSFLIGATDHKILEKSFRCTGSG